MMFSKAIEKIKDSIFPIFAQILDINKIRLAGTGFFIDENGLFVTADHNLPPNTIPLYAGNNPNSINNPNYIKMNSLEIKEIKRYPEIDTIIGRIEKDYGTKLELSKKKPKIGTSVCLCGYPLLFLNKNYKKKPIVRNFWEPTFVIDYHNASGVQEKYTGFLTLDSPLKAMSGGPVIGNDGIVYGMITGTFTRYGYRLKTDEQIPISNGVILDAEIILETIQNI